MAEYKHTESALIHGGNTIDPLTGAVNVPILPAPIGHHNWL